MHRPHRRQQRLMICPSNQGKIKKRVKQFADSLFYFVVIVVVSGWERWLNLCPAAT